MTLPTIRFDLAPSADGNMYSAHPTGNRPSSVGISLSTAWALNSQAAKSGSFLWELDYVIATDHQDPTTKTLLTNQLAVMPIGSRLFEGTPSTSAVTTSTKISCPGEFTGVRVILRNHMAGHAEMRMAVAASDSIAQTYGSFPWGSVSWDGQATVTPSDALWYKPNAILSDEIAIESKAAPDGKNNQLLIRGYPAVINSGWFSYPKPPLSAAATPTAANRGIVYQIGTLAGDQVSSTNNDLFSSSTTGQQVGAVFSSVNYGLSVMGIGDSLMQCDGVSYSDRYSSYGLRACADATTSFVPVSFFNAGGSGYNSGTYKDQGLGLADVIKPNVIVYHAWSPNDFWTPDPGLSLDAVKSISATMATRASQVVDYCAANNITLIMCTGVPFNKLDTAEKDAVRKEFNAAIIAGTGYYVLDLAKIVGDGNSPEGFLAEYGEGDGVHYNEAALDAVATRLSSELRKIIANSQFPVIPGNKSVTVDADGNGDGSSARPWTLQQAMTLAVAGDRVIIEPGVYVGTRPDGEGGLRFTPAFFPKNDGTEENPIIFEARHPATTTTDPALRTEIRTGGFIDLSAAGAYTPWDARQGWPAFGTSGYGGGNWTTWDGIYSDARLENCKTASEGGLCSVSGSIHATVRRCRLIGESSASYLNNNYAAVRFEAAEHVTIVDNHLSDFGSKAMPVNNQGVGCYDTVSFTVEHNTIERCGHAFHPKAARFKDLTGTFRYNLVRDCYHVARIGAMRELVVTGVFSEIAHNVCINNTFFMEMTTSDGVMYHDYYKVHNNSWLTTSTAGPGMLWFAATPPPGQSNVWDNIFSGGGAYIGANSNATTLDNIGNWADFDTNCVDVLPMGRGNSYVNQLTKDIWQNTYGNDVNSIFVDPQFVSSTDLRLKATSPCRTASITGGPIGAYVTGSEQIGHRT